MRVCMRVGAWMRSHFAEVSKMAQDAPRAGTQEHKQHRTQAPEPERGHQRKPRSRSARAPSARV